MNPQTIQSEKEGGLERVIDFSRTVSNPERLAWIVDAARDAVLAGHDGKIYEEMVELEFLGDFHLLQGLGEYLRDSYMPEATEKDIPCGCLGLGYFNNKDDDPRMILLRVKRGNSALGKTFTKTDGGPIYCSTEKGSPEGVYEMIDPLAGRFVCSDEQAKERMINRLEEDPNLLIKNKEEVKGGRSGMYFATHLEVEYGGRLFELQMHTEKSHKMSKMDREEAHPDSKYDWQSKVKPLPAQEQEEYTPEVS